MVEEEIKAGILSERNPMWKCGWWMRQKERSFQYLLLFNFKEKIEIITNYLQLRLREKWAIENWRQSAR
jgi:hypothetical protein